MGRTLFAALLSVCVATPAFAWNALGHKAVAEIAWRELDESSRQRIVETLQRHPRFDADFASKMTDDALHGDQATQDRWIFLQAACWPDIARGLPAGERTKYDRPKWHYINLPLYLGMADRQALAHDLPANLAMDYPGRVPQEDYNAMQAIAYCRDAIGEPGLAAHTKALAYCWLFHLVGDIHQPLHSSALFSVDRFPQGDRGGNEIPLARGENLHKLWDNLLGRRHYLRNVDKAVAELSDRERFGDVWQSAGRETRSRRWLQESHELCESLVYSDEILQAVRDTPPGMELLRIVLPESYRKRAGDEARRRIIAAGLRLAAVLKSSER